MFHVLEGQQVPTLVGWHLLKFPKLKFILESLGFEEENNNTFREILRFTQSEILGNRTKYFNLTLDPGICYAVRTDIFPGLGDAFEWFLKCEVSDNKF